MVTTQSLVLEAPERLVMQTFEVPLVGHDDGLLAVELAGICGTDWKTFHGKLPYPTPVILGHEILGHLARIGAHLSERTGLREGDRVTVGSSVPCWSCRACHSGNYRFCGSKRGYGTSTPSTVSPHLWGAFGSHMYIAAGSILHKVDESIPAEAAVLVQGVVANGIQWVVTRGGVRPGMAVVIQGSGPQGLACAMAAREAGASSVIVTGLGRDTERLALARELGAHATVDVEREDVLSKVMDLTGGELADVVVDVSGSTAGVQASVKLVRTQGTLVLAGLTGREAVTPMLLDQLVWKEITVRGSLTKGSEAVHNALKLVASRRYPLEKMITHRFPLAQAEEAIRAIGGERPDVYPIKAAIVPAGAVP